MTLASCVVLGAVGVALLIALWGYLYYHMDLHLTPRPHTDIPTPEFVPNAVISEPGARADDITFNSPPTRPLSDFFGEQLVFESICGAHNLHSVFTAYAMADASQQRECSRDERMFYDACLGGTVRGLIDAHRARTPETETAATSAHAIVSTLRH